jgi:hypothetical protein
MKEKYRKLFGGSRISLPFTELNRRNDDNRICSTTKRKGNLSSAFEKDDSQWNYLFKRWHSRTETIFEVREKTELDVL